MRYRRFTALLLAWVLAAGLAAAPVRVRAEETGENPPPEEVLEEKDLEENEEGKPDGENTSEERTGTGSAQVLPAQEKKEEEPEEGTGESVRESSEEKKDTTEETEKTDGEALPADAGAGMRLLGAGAGEEQEEPEYEYEYYDALEDMEIVVGQEEDEYAGNLYARCWVSDSEVQDIELTVTKAVSDDLSVADVALNEEFIEVTGKSTGRTRITVTYNGPEGTGTTGFYVTVKEIIYYPYIYSDETDYFVDPNSSIDLRLEVSYIKAGEEDYGDLEEKDVTVVWTNEPDEDYEDILSLTGNGCSAVFGVGDVPYHETVSGCVRADVYLGSQVSKDNLIGSGTFEYLSRDYYYAWDVDIEASESYLFDDASSESVITLYPESDEEVTVQKWVAVKIGDDGKRERVLDYPFEEAGSPLSTTINGEILAGLLGDEGRVEIFAVLDMDQDNGREVTTDSVEIWLYRGEKTIRCDVEDVSVLPGDEYTEYVNVTADIWNAEHPVRDFFDCEILGAEAEDPSMAEIYVEEDMLCVKGIKTGTTRAYLIYRDPDGEEGKCPFTVKVKDVIYYVYLDDSYNEFEMLKGDRAEMKVTVTRAVMDGEETVYTDLEEDAFDVVWKMESHEEGSTPPEDFTLETDGSRAVLTVTGDVDPEEGSSEAAVVATVYLKGTEEEIGSEESVHIHERSMQILTVKDTLPEDRDRLEVGESFTLTPCVTRRKETGDGEILSTHEDRARFGLYFDPSQVRVMDQDGREVAPAQIDDDYYLIDGQEDGVVYTVTRLSREEIYIGVTAARPGEEGQDTVYPLIDSKFYYLGSLDEDEPDDPGNKEETDPQEGSGKDQENAASSSTGKSGKNASSSKTAKTAKASGASKKTATGDASDAMLLILLMTASASVCLAAAGSLKKKAGAR